MSQATESMEVDAPSSTTQSLTTREVVGGGVGVGVGGGKDKSNLPELLDASVPSVQEKYKCAGVIANTVLHQLIKSCAPGVSVVELCKLGDMMIDNECAKVFPTLKSRGQKGVAFPTCISTNEIAGHYSPLSEDTKSLSKGDIVKIDLGVHIDGFAALAAHTIVLGPTTGRKADVIAAAWSGAQAALRMLKPKNKNSQVTAAITKCAESFKCEPMESVLSHEMRQYVLDHENTILLKETVDRKVTEFSFEDFQVFGIDIMMSTGRGKAIERGEKCTIFKRNVEIDAYNLKLKTSRDLIKAINKNYPTFPFTMRNFETERFRFGISECKNHALVQPYPVLAEKSGDYVAQFKFTVILTPKETIHISGLPLDMSQVNPQYKIEDSELQSLLDQPFAGTKPAFFEIPQFAKFDVDMEEKKQSKENQQSDKKTSNTKNKNKNKNQGQGQGPKNPNAQKNQQNQQNQPKNVKKNTNEAAQTNTAPKSNRMDVD